MSEDPQRRRRISRACDQCHRTNIKCTPSNVLSSCKMCHDFQCDCTYKRPLKKRGPRAAPTHSEPPPAPRTLPYLYPFVYPEPASASLIMELVEAYHSIVYPIFPLFHWPTFIPRIRADAYRTDRALFITTMAVCAIVSARFRNGVPPDGFTSLPVPASEVFATAATEAFPTQLADAKGFEYMRAKALLAILYIQYGGLAEHSTHLGEYTVLASNCGLYDEKRWETGLRETDLQERRRVFWSIYTLDVYSAITWGGIIRFRENQSHVLYPAELDDEFISPSGIAVSPSDHVSFMQGWNFTTTMYRVLEHQYERLRATRRTTGGDTLDDLFVVGYPASKEVLDRLMIMYCRLPDSFKIAKPMTGDMRRDRLGFQAANIIITLQTVKLALAAAEDLGADQRCHFASELINALAAIPASYIVAVSRPMLHHLASCGHLLGSVIKRPLSQQGLLQVRGVLQAMADLLCGFETTLGFPADISTNLRTHITRIDGFLPHDMYEEQGQALQGTILQFTSSPSPPLAGSPGSAMFLRAESPLWLPSEQTTQLQSDSIDAWRPEAMWRDWGLGFAERGLLDFGIGGELVVEDNLAWLFNPTPDARRGL